MMVPLEKTVWQSFLSFVWYKQSSYCSKSANWTFRCRQYSRYFKICAFLTVKNHRTAYAGFNAYTNAKIAELINRALPFLILWVSTGNETVRILASERTDMSEQDILNNCITSETLSLKQLCRMRQNGRHCELSENCRQQLPKWVYCCRHTKRCRRYRHQSGNQYSTYMKQSSIKLAGTLFKANRTALEPYLINQEY